MTTQLQNKKWLSLILIILFSVSSLYGQGFVPNYLKTTNEFIQENLQVVDSAGWLMSLPGSDIQLTDFWINHKSDFEIRNIDI